MAKESPLLPILINSYTYGILKLAPAYIPSPAMLIKLTTLPGHPTANILRPHPMMAQYTYGMHKPASAYKRYTVILI